MNIKAKGELIGVIISNLKFEANRQGKFFKGDEVLLSLAFKSDEELERIAKLAGV